MKLPLNYDNIATDYDDRFDENGYQGILNALRGLLSQEYPQKVLEVGCGTCYWLKALRVFKASTLIGIDSSAGMLKKAQKSFERYLCLAVAENLPLAEKSLDRLFCINALHQFSAKTFIKESHRILKPGGKIAIIGTDPRDQRNKWYIYEYFEGTYQTDLSRFPSWTQVKSWLSDVGFQNIKITDIETIHAPKFDEAIFEDPFLKMNGCSQLALLSQEEYRRGIELIKKTIKNSEKGSCTFKNDIVFSMITGEKSDQ
jgi:ubiquinone/menaquinone biosynthesis C-methylase UbiE